MTGAPTRPPTADLPVLLAFVGSAVLAVPGVIGLGGLVLLVIVAFDAGETPDVLTVASVGLGISAIAGLSFAGFYLLRGYWQARLGGPPAPRPLVFWRLSTGYNTLAVALSALAWTGADAGPLAIGVGAWSAFVAWVSLVRSRQARLSDHPARAKKTPAPDTQEQAHRQQADPVGGVAGLG